MGSFLKRAIRGEEPDSQNDPAVVEESYYRMFPKMGRDFLHRDDFAEIMRQVLMAVGITEDDIDLYLIDNAIARAMEYRSILSSGDADAGIYADLIDLEDS
jgi:3-oxoacyl-[acyl-carrier-protein] synthase III